MQGNNKYSNGQKNSKTLRQEMITEIPVLAIMEVSNSLTMNWQVD